MLQLQLTEYGINKMNTVLVEPNLYFDIQSLKANQYTIPMNEKKLRTQTKLELSNLDGYVTSVTYNDTSRSIMIQGIFPAGLPETKLNGVALYDASDNMVGFATHGRVVEYTGGTLRYFFWLSLLNQNNQLLDINKVQLVLPENKVVHQTYQFDQGSNWMLRHHLQTPIVTFTVYNSDYTQMDQNEYICTANVGYLAFDFKGSTKAGYVSVIGEGFSMSMRGESINIIENKDDVFKVNSDIPWIIGSLLN